MNILPFLPNIPAGPNARVANQQTQMGESGWQREMERAEAQAWLLHPVVEHQNNVALFGRTTYFFNASTQRENNQQFESSEKFDLKDGKVQEQEKDSSSFFKYSQPIGYQDSMHGATQAEATNNPLSTTDHDDAVMCVSREMTDSFIQKLNQLLSDVIDSEKLMRSEGAANDNESSDLSNRAKEFKTEFHASRPANGSAAWQDLRLHVEWSPQGAHLWVGVDAKDEEVIPQLAQYLLRRLNESGINVVVLVCNGRTLYQNPIQMNENKTRLPGMASGI
jgi:hypothetical protein